MRMETSAVDKTSPKSPPKSPPKSSPIGLHIEVGGAKPGSRASGIPGCKCVDVRALPNPFASLEKGTLDNDMESITSWITARQKTKFDRFVNEVLQQLLKQRCVRVQCYGGKHRSAAVANAALDKYNSIRTDCMRPVKIVMLDA